METFSPGKTSPEVTLGGASSLGDPLLTATSPVLSSLGGPSQRTVAQKVSSPRKTLQGKALAKISPQETAPSEAFSLEKIPPKKPKVFFSHLASFFSSECCYLKGIGPVYGQILKNMGLKTFWDMLCYMPYDFHHYNIYKKQKEFLVQWNVKIQKPLGQKPWRYLCHVLQPPSPEEMSKWTFALQERDPQKLTCILTFFKNPDFPLGIGSQWIAKGALQCYRGQLYLAHPKLKTLKTTEQSFSGNAENKKSQEVIVQGRYKVPESLTSEQFQKWIQGIFALWPQKDICSMEMLVDNIFYEALQSQDNFQQWIAENLPRVCKNRKLNESINTDNEEKNPKEDKTRSPEENQRAQYCYKTIQGAEKEENYSHYHHSNNREIDNILPLGDFSFTLHNTLFYLHFGAPCDVFRSVLLFYLACYEALAQDISLGLQDHYKNKNHSRAQGQKILTPPRRICPPEDSYVTKILKNFGHHLTPSQEKAFQDISEKLQSPDALCHLLQGDVGTGKSIVAFLLLGLMVDWGYKAILMTPTQSLTYQHFRQLNQWVPVHHVLKTGKHQGTLGAPLLVGTHSLLHCAWEDPVFFQGPLGLVVIDEQQRFGLGQRAQLVAQEVVKNLYESKGLQDINNINMNMMVNMKTEKIEDIVNIKKQEKNEKEKEIKKLLTSSPYGTTIYCQSPLHVLNMSATPIPRTLERILLGSMGMSLLDYRENKPSISTSLVSSGSMDKILELIKKKRDLGQQVYWVCPSIEDDHSVEKRFLALQKIFSHDVAMVHGSMAQKDKYRVLEDFYEGRTGILVSTTVVEVGLDVPQATIMVVEQAHYFGLSQLHQLRGRVGRGKEESFCILLSDSRHHVSRHRLQLLKSCSDGFLLSKEDWKIRGGGSLLGEEQSGWPSYTFLGPHNAESILPLSHREGKILLEKQKKSNIGIVLEEPLSLLLHLFYRPISLGLQGG